MCRFEHTGDTAVYDPISESLPTPLIALSGEYTVSKYLPALFFVSGNQQSRHIFLTGMTLRRDGVGESDDCSVF